MFQVLLPRPFLIKKWRMVAVLKQNSNKEICSCLHKWLWQNHYCLATFHPSYHVRISFSQHFICNHLTKWNNLGNMKRIYGCHYFYLLIMSSTLKHTSAAALFLCTSKLVRSSLPRLDAERLEVWSRKIWNLIGQYRSRENERIQRNQICLNTKHKCSPAQ